MPKHNRRLERRIETAAEDRDAHADYALWLQGEAEPLGQLISASLDAIDEPPRERRRRALARSMLNAFIEARLVPRYPLLAERFRAWSKDRGNGTDGIANHSGTKVAWRWGLIRSVGMRDWTGPMLTQGLALLADPLCQFVEQVDLHGAPIDDLTPLSALKCLRRLSLSKTPLRDLGPIAGLKRLEQLSLSSSPITDLKPLRGLPKLWKLDLRSTKVESLAPLAELSSLEFVDLQSTPVTDLMPLMGLRRLWEVWLYGSKVSKKAARALEDRMDRWPIHDVSCKPLSHTRIVYGAT